MARAASPQNRRAMVSLTIATGCRRPVVARLELAAGEQANLQRPEVVRRDGVRQEGQVLVGARLVAVDRDALSPGIDERHRSESPPASPTRRRASARMRPADR